MSDPVKAQHSTRSALLLGGIAGLLLVVGIGGWAATTQLSGAVIASGKLVVDSNVKKIQHSTGGIVGELLVKEGDKVKQGDVVLRLDGTQTRSSLGIVNKVLEPYAGAVLGKILVLVAIILFIQFRPRGLFALKGRSVES